MPIRNRIWLQNRSILSNLALKRFENAFKENLSAEVDYLAKLIKRNAYQKITAKSTVTPFEFNSEDNIVNK